MSVVVAGALLGASCQTPSDPGRKIGVRRKIWVVGLNPTDSVSVSGDAKVSAVAVVTLATSVPQQDRVRLDKVFAKVENVIPLSKAPRGRDRTFGSWFRFMMPIPVPGNVLGTRGDLFFAGVAEVAREHPDCEVIACLVGDGFNERSDPAKFREVARSLNELTNVKRLIYLGATPGSIDAIYHDLAAAKSKIEIFPNVRDLQTSVAQIVSEEEGS